MMFKTWTSIIKMLIFNVIIEKVLLSKSFKSIENFSISFDIVIKPVLLDESLRFYFSIVNIVNKLTIKFPNARNSSCSQSESCSW